MNKGLLKPTLFISILVGLLTFLFLQTRTIDVAEQNSIILRFHNLTYQDALFNESILELRADQFPNYDPLTKYKRNIRNHLDWFKSSDSGIYGAHGNDLDNAIQDAADYFEDKFLLTERFKSHNGLLKNSLHYLPTAIKINQGNEENATNQSDLDQLLGEVLVFNSRPNEQNKIAASKLMVKLRNTGRQDLSQIALHAQTIIEQSLYLQKSVNELFSIPTRQSVDKIYQIYNQYSAIKLNSASTYRTAMYALALVLILYVLHLFSTLRKTMHSLEQSISELAFQKHALDEHSIVAIMNAEGVISYVNKKFNRVSQYSREEILGKNLTAMDPECSPVSFFTHVEESLVTGKSWKGETLNQKKDGSHYWVDATIVPFLDKKNNPLQYVALLTDITDRKKTEAEQQIVQSELRLAASVFSNSPMGIMITDADGSILRVNNAFSTITGFSSLQAVGQSVRILKSDYHETLFFSQMWNTLADTGQWEGEIWNRRSEGEIYPVWSNITAIHDSNGKTSHFINSFSDISEKKVIEDNIFYLAHYDALTDLPNRAMFLESVEKARLSDPECRIAVLFLDLDNFKMVNDTMGHAQGDSLLKNIAKKLLSCVRESDIVARLGGDEFTIALLDIQSSRQIEVIAKRILSVTKESLTFGGREILVSTSIGISIFPDAACSVELMIKNADTAMYRAKSDGKSKYQFFHKDLNIVSTERREIENDLRLAVNNRQFELHYQPQVIARSGEIFAVEALIRWNHPLYGLIPPNEFIPELENSGLIIEVGKWVIQEAFSQLAEWKSSGLHLRMAINISSRQLEDDHLPAYIQQLLNASVIEPCEIELELTESSLMKNPEYSISLLTELSDIGVNLALDDFGTGYSSLSYLKKVPIDTLKIDRSFVQDITTNQNDKAIANTIIAMARSLGLQVIGEGVETAEQFESLLHCGCDYVQGYYFGKPVPADKLELLLSGSRVNLSQTPDVRQMQ